MLPAERPRQAASAGGGSVGLQRRPSPIPRPGSKVAALGFAGELILLRVGQTFWSYFRADQAPVEAFRAGNRGSDAETCVAGPRSLQCQSALTTGTGKKLPSPALARANNARSNS